MRTGQRGAVLITGIVLLVVVAVMVATLGFLYVANLRSSSLHSSAEQAYFAALSGLERATRVVNSPTLAGAAAPDVNRVPCAGLTGNAAVTNVNVVANKGQFIVTGGAAVSPPTPVTLNGALTAAATVIPVTTLAALGGYSASGRIMIDRELIDYSGTSNVAATCGAAPCFVGARRGAAGTTAAAHATGTRVGQFQCNVQARGAVPDLANPRAARILSQGTQLHEGWTAGVAGGAGQQPWFARFRENVWLDYPFPGPAVATQINGISMLSYADGFAVGNAVGAAAANPRVFRWNGVAWNTVATGLAPPANRTLNSISCISANDCWAVGNTVGGAPAAQRPWIIHWTGVWGHNKGSLANTTVNLNSISCADTNNCWVVGQATGGNEYFVQWSAAPGLDWRRFGPSPAIPKQNFFSVHCVAANNCRAVGAATSIVVWNGAAWAIQGVAGPAFVSQLNSVWCVAANDCWAVGNNAAGEVILRWTVGPTWTRLPVSALIPSVNLNEVVCVKTDDCWIVGVQSAGELILHWDGFAWTRITPTAGVGNRNLVTIGVLGASQRAPAARQEVYP